MLPNLCKMDINLGYFRECSFASIAVQTSNYILNFMQTFQRRNCQSI